MSSKIFFPMFVVSAAALYLTAVFLPPADAYGEMELQKFASLPVQESGRIMPFDTFARIRLLVLGHKEWVADLLTDENGEVVRNEKGEIVEGKPMSQVAWALDTIVHKPETNERRFIRIDNDQLLAWLKLDPNRRGLRYSLLEFATMRSCSRKPNASPDGGRQQERPEGHEDRGPEREVRHRDADHRPGRSAHDPGVDPGARLPESARCAVAVARPRGRRRIAWSADPKALEYVEDDPDRVPKPATSPSSTDDVVNRPIANI